MVKSDNQVLYPILSINFIGTLGFGIILPFLIFMVTRYGGNAFIYGVLSATYSTFQILGAPILGKWSDKFGRRKILLLSQIGTLLSWLIFFGAMYLPVINLKDFDSTLLGKFSLTLPIIGLFVARAMDGLTGGNVSVANAYLADITKESERSKNFGKMAISSNLGYVLGPALAGILGATIWGDKLPVLAAILISLVASFIIYFRLPEYKSHLIKSNPERNNFRKILGQELKECYKLECKEKISFMSAMKITEIRLLSIINFLVYLGFNFFYIAFPVYAVKTLNWDLPDTGLFFSFLSIVMVIIQGPVLGFVSKKISDHALVLNGSLILSASFLLYLFQSNWLIYSGALLLAIGNGFMWPSILALISKSSPEKFQGAIQGYTSSLGSAASILGLLGGGLLYNLIESKIFLVAASIIFVIFVMTILWKNALK